MLTDQQLTGFLAHQWRKQACVFRQAINVADYPLTVDEICTLTGNDLVESRMISTSHELTLGPFEETGTGTARIPSDQLLLVQCLEQHFDVIGRLLREQFHFIPPWQVDDVMASVGGTGSSCGAHFDHYDVFLLQHQGNKRWQLDAGGHVDDDLDDDSEIRLLKDFTATDTWDLAPGDVLYIPPGTGHFGLCDGLSVTLSVGIRNPTPAELLADLSEFMIDRLDGNLPLNEQLYRTGAALPDSVSNELFRETSRLFSPSALQQWYGCYVTRLREPDLLEPNDDLDFRAGMSLQAALPTRMSYAVIDDLLCLFVNGEAFELSISDEDWVTDLCHTRHVQVPADPGGDASECLQSLLQAGAVIPSPLP